MSHVEPKELGQIPPKQTFVILVFLISASILPFLGLLPFLFFFAVLIYSIRSLKGFDKNRGISVLPNYLVAIRSACSRMLVWIVISFFIVMSSFLSGDVTVSDTSIDMRYVHIAQIFALAVALHFALLVRIAWHLKKGRLITYGDYTTLLLSVLSFGGGFFEKLIVRKKLKGK